MSIASREAALCRIHSMVLFSFLVSCPSLQSQKPATLSVFPRWEPENFKPLCSRQRGMLGCLVPPKDGV